MSKLIPGNQKHLTLNDRLYIEQAINEGRTFKDIAKNLCKDPTTISKEVKAHRLSVWKDHGLFVNMKNFCEHRYHCRKTNACGKIILCGIKCASCPTCNQHCPDFKRERCQHPLHWNLLFQFTCIFFGCNKSEEEKIVWHISGCKHRHSYTEC